MARNDPQVNFRIPADLLEQVRDSAKAGGRSLSAEIVYRLTASFPLEEIVNKQEQLIAAFSNESETTEKIIKDIARMLAQALKDQAANEPDGVVAALADVLKAPKSQRIRTVKKKS